MVPATWSLAVVVIKAGIGVYEVETGCGVKPASEIRMVDAYAGVNYSDADRTAASCYGPCLRQANLPVVPLKAVILVVGVGHR